MNLITFDFHCFIVIQHGIRGLLLIGSLGRWFDQLINQLLVVSS